jgi:hypothetical protein
VSGGDYGEKDHKTCLPFAVPPSAQTQALARGATVPTPKCPKPVACDATFAKTYNKTWATDKHKAGQPYFCNVKSGAAKTPFCAILKLKTNPFTKTGSGQPQEETSIKKAFCFYRTVGRRVPPGMPDGYGNASFCAIYTYK